MLARHVSDLTGPSSGAFYKLYSQICYVVIRVLLDTSSCCEVVGMVNGEVHHGVGFTLRCAPDERFRLRTLWKVAPCDPLGQR